MPFCCPRCHGALTSTPDAHRCATCSRDYPIVFGIPDFRLDPDPYISVEDEYRKAGVLAAAANRLSFEALVRFYWEITPGVPDAAVSRYVRSALTAEERGAAYVETLDGYAHGQWAGEACLEIGCGSGGFLGPAASRFDTVVGVDVALRWLVVARHRLAQTSGRNIALVCCSAERLPFPDSVFDAVVGLHMLEHARSPRAVLSEGTRMLKQGRMCFFCTPNRFSVGPEPCVRVFGVGFLPRCLADRYVRLVRGTPYRHIRLLSSRELAQWLAQSGLRWWTVQAARIPESDERALSRAARLLIRVYHRLRELPMLAALLRTFGPLLDVVGRR